MNVFSVPTLLVLLALSTGASAQMFKWVDEKGVTHFSDQPPPPNAKKAEIKAGGASYTSDVALPYELAQAVKNFPVTIYTMSNCSHCDQGRTLLQQRGIPYTEKTINTNEDQAQLSAAGGNGSLPFFVVGNNKINGFEATLWNNALTSANYPSSRMLPANYKNPGVESAAVAKGPTPAQQKKEAERIAKAEAAAAAAEAERIKRKPAINAPPDFQF